MDIEQQKSERLDLQKNQQHLRRISDFQKDFFTDWSRFESKTDKEIQTFGYILCSNIAKGFPGLIDGVYKMKGFRYSGPTSFEILRALRHKLVNRFSKPGVPSYVYYKTPSVKKQRENISVKNNKGSYVKFAPDIVVDICNILKIDSKTYNYLEHTNRIQYIGKQITGQIKEELKMGRNGKGNIEEINKTNKINQINQINNKLSRRN